MKQRSGIPLAPTTWRIKQHQTDLPQQVHLGRLSNALHDFGNHAKGLHDNHAFQANTLHDWQLHRLRLQKDKQCHVVLFYLLLIRGGEAPPYK